MLFWQRLDDKIISVLIMTKNKLLNSNQLKLIAIVAMTVDHIAWAVFPGYPLDAVPVIMHIIGRLTCPIMCYFIAEGYHYTKNINKYTARLFVFAVISHFAYIFASNDFVDAKSFIPFYYGNVLNQTSVMWSLAWGLVMLRVANSEKLNSFVKVLSIIAICVITLPSDWSCVASAVYFFAIDKVYGLIQMCVVLSIPIIYLYNGERGKKPKINKFMKWLFYIYYPLHLSIIGIINLTA